MYKIKSSQVRIGIQIIFALICVWIGYEFIQFYDFMTGESTIFIKKPAGVEGFLPISGLLAFKRLITQGVFDPVHPAGLTIFIAAMAISLFFRKGFCGYICPVGLIHNFLNKIGKKLKITIQVKGKIETVLLLFKYIVLAFFVITVFIKMNAQAINAFLLSAYNFTAEARMLHFFENLSTTALFVFALLIFLGLIIPYFWCRFLCPYGALLGILSFFSPTIITRDETICINCKKCTKSCPGGIIVDNKNAMKSPECIGCTECISVCPVEDCLNVTERIGKNKLPWFSIALGTILFFTAYYITAKLTNHWDSPIPIEMIQKYYLSL